MSWSDGKKGIVMSCAGVLGWWRAGAVRQLPGQLPPRVHRPHPAGARPSCFGRRFLFLSSLLTVSPTCCSGLRVPHDAACAPSFQAVPVQHGDTTTYC